MKFMLVVFAVAAAAAGGYIGGDTGEAGLGVFAAGAAVAVLLLIFAIIPDAPSRPTVSLRPSGDRPAPASRIAQARVLHPGEAARLRERERLLANAPEVAVRLIDSGRNQIAVIKVLRNYLDLGLKDAKELSDAARKGASPLVVAQMAVDRAREFAEDIENAGGQVEFVEPQDRPR
jgi:ribosomal protein L7/L12